MKTTELLKFAYISSVILLSVIYISSSCNNSSKTTEVQDTIVTTDSLTNKQHIQKDSVKTTTLSSDEKRTIRHILRNITRNL